MSNEERDRQRFNLDRAVAYSIEAIKAAMLLNGAAAIALLAFLSSTKDSRVSVDVQQVKHALISFAIGASLCALTFLTAYLTQVFFAGVNVGETHSWSAQVLRWGALVLFIASIVLFGIGVYCAASALS